MTGSIIDKMRIISKKTMKIISEEIEDYNLNGLDFFILKMVFTNEKNINQVEISEFIGVDKATITRRIKKLEKKCFLKRVKKEKDKRSYNIVLTEKSKKLKNSLINRWFEVEKEVISKLNENQVENLNKTLNEIINNLEENKEGAENKNE